MVILQLKIRYCKSVFVLIILFVSFVIQPSLSQSYPVVKNPDKYIVASLYPSSDSLDTASNYGSFGSGINSLICETLYDFNGNSVSNLIPQLASALPVIDINGTQYNISLKQGIYFTDGTEFNAWTYKYSLDRAIILNDPSGGVPETLSFIKGASQYLANKDNNASEAYNYLAAGGIKVINDYSIQFNLEKAYAGFIPAITNQPGCATSPKFFIDHTQFSYSSFVPDDTNNSTGMIKLNKWFPELAGNYTRLGLNATLDSAWSGVVPSGIVDYSTNSPAQFWYGVDHQIGTGPWILNSRNASIIVLDKNINWWNKAAFATYSPDEILIKYDLDPQTIATQLTNGDIDAATSDAQYNDQFINSDGGQKIINVSTYQSLFLSDYFIGFNLRNGSEIATGYIDKYSTSSSCWDSQSALEGCGLEGYVYWNKSPDWSNPFTVLRFRKAFSFSLDYQKLIDTAVNGFGERMQGLIPVGLLGHQSDLITKGYIPTYDPDVAKALFQQVGWQGSITIEYNSSNLAEKTAAIMLKNSIESLNAGIYINVVSLPVGVFGNYLVIENYLYHQPVKFTGWSPDYGDPDEFMTPLYHSTKGYFSNQFAYNNSDIDPLMDQASTELNSTIRIEEYKNLESIIAQENIIMYCYQPINIFLRSYRIKNFFQSGSLNPLRYFDRVQFLNKEPIFYYYPTTDSIPEIPTIPSTSGVFSNQSSPFNSNDILNTLINGLFIAILFGAMIGILFIYDKKVRFKKENVESSESTTKDNKFNQKEEYGSLSSAINKLDEMIDEFSEK